MDHPEPLRILSVHYWGPDTRCFSPQPHQSAWIILYDLRVFLVHFSIPVGMGAPLSIEHIQWIQFTCTTLLSSCTVALQSCLRDPTTISEVERFSWRGYGNKIGKYGKENKYDQNHDPYVWKCHSEIPWLFTMNKSSQDSIPNVLYYNSLVECANPFLFLYASVLLYLS